VLKREGSRCKPAHAGTASLTSEVLAPKAIVRTGKEPFADIADRYRLLRERKLPIETAL